MKKFMLLLFEEEGAYEDFTAEDMKREIEAHNKWIEELGKHYISGEPLEKPARTIRGEEKLVTDGPFIESKELVSGFYMLQAETFEKATELARGCPVLRLGGSVEVREVMVIEQPKAAD